jgi:thymidylate synthase
MSVDSFKGLPFNIASYALLLSMLAQVVDMEPYELIFDGGDCHIYPMHVEAVREQISREPYPLATLKLNPEVKDILAFTEEDIELLNYVSHPEIKGDIAV